jgi:hypothetical protein
MIGFLVPWLVRSSMASFQRSSMADETFSDSDNLSAAPFLLHRVSVWVMVLYVVLSPPVLPMIGWSYGGGGSELEKIHPATYLLIVLLPLTMTYDWRFRVEAMRLILEPAFLLFIIASIATAAYAILVKQVSAAPFVDTFISTILVTAFALALPRRALEELRTLIDVTILINVILIFIEFTTQRGFILGAGEGFGPMRWTGLLGLPLTAAQIFAVYSLTTFVSSPVRLSGPGPFRMVFSMLAMVSCLLTGGRTSIALLVGLLALYVLFSAMRQLLVGLVNWLGLIYALVGLVIMALSIPLLVRIGVFDILSARVEFDNGSSLARDGVIAILNNLSMDKLWLGIEAIDAYAIQQSYGLIAIEIAWANYVIICGLVFTIPLFIGFCLFWFWLLPKYCGFLVVLVSAFTLVHTFAYNSIWSKTTVLAITVAIAVSNLRRDILDPQAAHRLRFQ